MLGCVKPNSRQKVTNLNFKRIKNKKKIEHLYIYEIENHFFNGNC